MWGRPAFERRAFLLALLLRPGWHPALAPNPAEAEAVGGGCEAADETTRLQCQLDEARALVSRLRLMVKEKDMELARKDVVTKAACKDMEAKLTRQDAASALEDVVIKEQADDPDLWRHSHQSQYLVEKARPPQEQADDPDLWRHSHQNQYLVEKARPPQEYQYPDLRRHSRLSKHRHVAEKDTIERSGGTSSPSAPWPAALAGRRTPQEQHGRLLDDDMTETDLPTIIAGLPTNTTNISLPYSGLQGTLPADLGRLTNLQYLDLSGNYYLSGTIPPELGNLTQLRHLDLSSIGLSGAIPPELGGLTQLTYLNLRQNALTGTLPADLGGLTNLQYLDLSGNYYIAGPIPPELGNLAQLRHLDLNSGRLGGTIPPELGNLTQLTYLDLQSVVLTGTLPADLGRLTNLQYLDLSYNYLGGTIPPELGNLTQLRHLDMQRNGYLQGTIPPELGKLTQLEYVNLNTNAITGTIPPELGNMTQLRHLDLNTNRLTGTIPPQLDKLTQLEFADLNSNAITGTIPPELGNLTQLVMLFLYNNKLTGTIPPELGNLTQLTNLPLSINELEGPIPKELGKLVNLNSLQVFSNRLNGTIPPELGMTQLQTLNLGINGLTGPIPEEFGNLVNLTTLNLGNNKLNGTIPPDLGKLTQLTKLALDNNTLTGTIPPDLGNLTNLKELLLAKNALTGPMPKELGNLFRLDRLLLYDNQLNGTIPPEFGKLTWVSDMELHNNELTGPIPKEFGADMYKLGRLWLRVNQLSGTIPPELGDIRRLTELSLQSNKLTGTIPPELGNLTWLASLELNNNGLTGTIPPELGKLPGRFQKMDVSRNGLTGTLPEELGSLMYLQTLNVAGNALSGTLPEAIVQLKVLVSLDVSDNPGITGAFPDTTTSNLPSILASNCSFTSIGAVGPVVQKISFAYNSLTEFPDVWLNLPLVLELDVSHNNISVWRPHGVLPAAKITECGNKPLEPRFQWPAMQSVKLSGNPLGRSTTLRDFLWSMAYLTGLSELFAAGCQLYGVFLNDYGGFGTEDQDTGDCPYSERFSSATGYSPGFRGLLTLDLSDNDITAIIPPPPPRLYTADLHGNPLVDLHVQWYTTPRTVKVWNAPFLRANVPPPSRALGCPTGGTPGMEADPFGFVTKLGEDAFQCTTLCVTVTTRYEHDASLNVSSLCRCTAGRQGAATSCSGCRPDTYSHYDAKDTWAMVRTCRPCPERSSTENVGNATSVDQCKCQAGWYMVTLSTGGDPSCKRCTQGLFMDTLHGATQEAQCICNKSYDGLRALQGSCGCADGQYMDNVALACRRCDAVAEECTWGYNIGLSLLPPVIKASYWAAQPPEVGPEEVSTFSQHDIWRCFSKDTCLRNSTCASGRSGTACSLCDEGMYGGPDGPCKPCPYNPEDARKNLLYGLLIGPAATIAAHTLLSLHAGKLASAFACLRTSGKQSLKYLQMLGVMAGFNIDWPPLAFQFITAVARITVALPEVAGVACLTGQQTASLEMGFRWLMPVAGLLSACLGPLVLAPIRICFRKSRCYKLMHMSYWDVLRVSLWGLVLFYSTLLQFGTQVLACVPGPNGMRTVVTFPHLRCGATTEWTQLATVSVAFLLVFVGALFLGIYAAWRRATHALVKSNFESSGWWGFLFDDYRKGWEHWLMVTMAKDAALVVIATAGASNGPSQLLSTAAVSTVYSYVVLRDQPFRQPSNSVLEVWTMMSVAVISVFTAGMGFQSASGVADVTELFSDGAADPEYKKREEALLVVQCLTFVGPAGIMLYQLLCASDKVRRRLPASIRPSTKEEREKWNTHFITSMKLDEATAPVLWGVIDQFDVVDNAKFRDLMTTSMATLDIVPNNAHGISIKRMVRKRIMDIANTSENRKVPAAAAALDVPAPPVPPAADPSEDEHRGGSDPGIAAVVAEVVATADVRAALSTPVMLRADGHRRLEYL